MNAAHRRNTGPMLSSPRCGAKTRSGKPCRSPAVREKNGVVCMAVRRDPAHRAATKTRSSTASIRAKPGRNVGGCRTCCGNRARSLKRSPDRRRIGARSLLTGHAMPRRLGKWNPRNSKVFSVAAFAGALRGRHRSRRWTRRWRFPTLTGSRDRWPTSRRLRLLQLCTPGSGDA